MLRTLSVCSEYTSTAKDLQVCIKDAKYHCPPRSFAVVFAGAGKSMRLRLPRESLGPTPSTMNADPLNPQLSLPFLPADLSLGAYFAGCLGRPVALVLTDNGTNMLSARHKGGVLCIRLHRMFLHADSGVMSEIVSYLKNRRGAMPRFRSFIRQNGAQLRPKPAKRVFVRTRGRFHDLCALYDEINRDYFGGAVAAAITWGARNPRAAVRRRTVGSYSERSNLIRINPVLDRGSVPRCYVAFIVYHEMLHASMGTVMQGKRRSVHSREFRRREKLFAQYDTAMAWEGGKATDAC